jgi:hypothetical protein
MQTRCLILQYWLFKHCDCLVQVTIGTLVVVVFVVLRAYKFVANVNSKTVNKSDEKCMIERMIGNCLEQYIYIHIR